MRLILASGSPRRKDILTEAGFTFEVITAEFAEENFGACPKKIAIRNATGKAKAVFNGLEDKRQAVVLGADTIVVLDGEILGKPKDKQHAFNMLSKLSGREHSVITGYAFVREEGVTTGSVISNVTFNNVTEAQIKEYIESGIPMDKSGGYAVQDSHGLVKKYHGSLTNIIGLPIEEVQLLLKIFNMK